MAIKRRKKTLRKPKMLRYSMLLMLLIIAVGGYMGRQYYNYVMSSNVHLQNKKDPYLYIPTGATFNDVVALLDIYKIVNDKEGFLWVAKHKKYAQNVKAGRFKLTEGMSNNSLINLLRSGKQAPVNLTFNNIRTSAQLAGRLAAQLEPDSLTFLKLFRDNKKLQHYDVTQQTVISLFIPNTYKVFWNTSPESLLTRMKKEYDQFWNKKRLTRLKTMTLTKQQVITLASIVDEETSLKKEKPTVAGLYINRFNRGILLQADPTLRFAANDFTIKRVLDIHKRIKSPYNTYKNKGLPPGPIRMPSIDAIDAVLNYEHHNYIYMCAKEDFSGAHNFAKTLREHNNNAKRYHRALNKRRIYK